MSIAKLAEQFKLLTGAILLALALVLGGCGGDVQEEQQDVQEEQEEVQEVQEDLEQEQKDVQEEQQDVEEQQKEAAEEQPDIQQEQDIEPEQDVEPEQNQQGNEAGRTGAIYAQALVRTGRQRGFGDKRGQGLTHPGPLLKL